MIVIGGSIVTVLFAGAVLIGNELLRLFTFEHEAKHMSDVVELNMFSEWAETQAQRLVLSVRESRKQLADLKEALDSFKDPEELRTA